MIKAEVFFLLMLLFRCLFPVLKRVIVPKIQTNARWKLYTEALKFTREAHVIRKQSAHGPRRAVLEHRLY